MSVTQTIVNRIAFFRKISIRLAVVLSLLFITTALSFNAAAQTTFENPPFVTGTVHNQNGWNSLGSAGLGCNTYDHAVTANNAFAPLSFGAQSLRISNAVTGGCFHDNTFSASLANEAGETSAVSNGQSGGVRQNNFEYQFSLASAVPGAQQPGMIMSVAPDRGDGARMSYLRFEDQADGIHVIFDDYIDAAPFGGAVGDTANGCGVEDDFTDIDIATLSRTAPHTIKFVMNFYDGSRNDVVKIYIDGVLVKTGTSWEDYFRYCEAQPTRTVDSMLFRTGGAAVPANAGKGFLIDNATSGSSSTLLVDDNGAECPTAPYTTIQSAINAANPGDTIKVCGGTYVEDVNVNKANLVLDGSGVGNTTISGAIGGDSATVRVSAANAEIKNFTITRQGNTTTDWNNAGLNSAGIAIQGAIVPGALIHDNIITGNRSGIDVNNSNGHTIRNNVIDNNRTGVIFGNQTDNITFVENFVNNNWTVGILFLDRSGAGVPPQSSLNSTFSNNNLSGNWYGQIADRQSGGSLPAPGTTNLKNFRGNWFGTATPVVTTANTTEPGYAAQIPVAYGGTATAPGGQPDIAGPASANFKHMPLLTSGTDTNIETTPGRGTFGFQGASSVITVKSSMMNGWSAVSQRTASGSFVSGPGTPPLGFGSYRMTTGAGNSGSDLPQGGAGQGGKTWITTQQFDNTLLSSITQLGFSTYVAASPSSAGNIITPTLQLQVDLDGNGTRDSAMIFEPYYSTVASGGTQSNVALGQWQTWNARAGKWWFNNATVFGCGQCAFPTLDAIIAAYPNAKIVTWYALTDGHGTQFVAGQNSAGAPWANFDGNIDAFTITVNAPNTTFDFEPESPSVTINQAVGQADPTGVSPINFTVVFSEPMTGFGDSPSDVILSGTAGATTAVVTGSGTTYNVAVSGMIADGTVIAAVAAGAAQAASTAPNAASTSTDNTVTYFLPRAISGQILKNGVGLQSVSVALTGSSTANTVTDANGNYSFANLPYNGSYLITPTFAGHTFEPINRSYSNLTVNVTNANFTATAGASPRIVRVVNGYTTPGQNVTVPVEMVSQGNENSVGFSLTYNSSLIFNPIVTLGSGATGGSLVVNSSTAGQIGILVALPSGQSFTAGTRQLVTITFNTAATMDANTPVNFSGAPVIRAVADPNADPLPATFINGFVVFSQGLEADVANRFTGDGVLAVDDFTQVGNFVAGIDTVNPNYNEFERADCAPRGSKGDGSLDVTDFTQAGRYAAGLDAYQTAGGPTTASLFSFNRSQTGKEGSKDAALLPRIVRVVNNTGGAGQQVTVSIEIDAEGDEAGVGFTLSYDPSKLSNPVVQLGTGTQGAALVPANTMTSGKVGVVLSYFGGPTILAGTRQVVTVRFDIALNAAPGQTPLSFTGFPPVVNRVSSAAATALTATFADGFVNILGPTAATVSIAGQVLTATGQNVSNAKVFLTDNQGVKRAAISNGFGYYSFEGVTVGETYILSVVSKRYTFTPQAVNVNEELTALNLIAEL